MIPIGNHVLENGFLSEEAFFIVIKKGVDTSETHRKAILSFRIKSTRTRFEIGERCSAVSFHFRKTIVMFHFRMTFSKPISLKGGNKRGVVNGWYGKHSWWGKHGSPQKQTLKSRKQKCDRIESDPFEQPANCRITKPLTKGRKS